MVGKRDRTLSYKRTRRDPVRRAGLPLGRQGVAGEIAPEAGIDALRRIKCGGNHGVHRESAADRRPSPPGSKEETN